MRKVILTGAIGPLLKAHINSFTRKDGTFVKEHDDGRKASTANGNHHPEAVKKTIANLDPDDWEHKDGKSTYGKYIKWGGANHDSAGESLLGNGFELDHDASSDTHEIFRHPEGHVANIKRDQGFKSAKFSIEHGGKASGSAKLSDGAGKVHAIAKQFAGSSAGEEDHYFYKDAAEHMQNNDHDKLKAHLKHGNDEQRENVLKHVHPDHHGKLADAPAKKPKAILSTKPKAEKKHGIGDSLHHPGHNRTGRISKVDGDTYHVLTTQGKEQWHHKDVEKVKDL